MIKTLNNRSQDYTDREKELLEATAKAKEHRKNLSERFKKDLEAR